MIYHNQGRISQVIYEFIIQILNDIYFLTDE